MRILTVGNMYPPHHQGGYELVWQAVVRGSRAACHDVRVLTTVHREPGNRPEEDSGVHRELRWYWSWEDYAFRELGLRGRVALERANAVTLRRHLCELRPDVVAWWAMGSMSLSLV